MRHHTSVLIQKSGLVWALILVLCGIVEAHAQTGVFSLLSADFTASPPAGPAPLTVQFTDLSTGNVAGWSWTFGDDSPLSTNENPSHIFDIPGIYNVTLVVSDGLGDTSDTNQLIEVFQVPPVNDDFTNRTVLGGATNYLVGSNVGATFEPGEPYDAGIPGGASVWWSWVAPASGVVTISTFGSSFDTTLGVYVGNSVTNLTLVASNNDADAANGVLTSLVSFDTQANVAYQISVDGDDSDPYFGSNGVINLSVEFGPRPQAPAWTAFDLFGNLIDSTNFAGRVLLLDFWQTSCQECGSEIAVLNDLQTKYTLDGLSLLGVNVDGGSATAATIYNYVTNNSIIYRVVIGDSEMQTAFGALTPAGMISVLPTLFIVDRENGVATPIFYGLSQESDLAQVIIPLLYANMKLGITAMQNGQYLVTWPATEVSWVLEMTTDLTSGVWSPVNTPVTTVAKTRQTVVPASGGLNQFFRLRIQ